MYISFQLHTAYLRIKDGEFTAADIMTIQKSMEILMMILLCKKIRKQ